MSKVFQISLYHQSVFSSEIHFSALHHSQAIDGLIFFQCKSLFYAIRSLVYTLCNRRKGKFAFSHKRCTVGFCKTYLLRFIIHGNGQRIGPIDGFAICLLDLDRHFLRCSRYNKAFLFCDLPICSLLHTYYCRREEGNFLCFDAFDGKHCERDRDNFLHFY